MRLPDMASKVNDVIAIIRTSAYPSIAPIQLEVYKEPPFRLTTTFTLSLIHTLCNTA